MIDHSFITEYLNQYFDEVSPKDFYRAVFPDGELAQKGKQIQGKYNAIAVEILNKQKNGKQVCKRYTITDDLDMVDKLIQSNDFIITSPISYCGKTRESKNARYIYGLAIDLDGVDKKQNIIDLIHQMTDAQFLPKATYIIASGSGVHIYYLFKQPLPCFNNIVRQLSTLKLGLVRKIWNQYTTTLSNNIQVQSVFQGFRMVGTITKDGKRTRAFEVGERVTINELNDFVLPEYQMHNYTYKSKLTLSEARVKYPTWYEKRIEQKKPKGTWVCKRDLYEWWKNKLAMEIREGHRYYGIMCLAVYAKKCGISFDEVSKDAYSMLAALDGLTKTEDNHFTNYDITAALDMYNDDYITFPIDTISQLTDIPIQKNRRNYRKQSLHLKIARSTLDIMNEEAGKALQGRPKKVQINTEKSIDNITPYKDMGRPKGSGTKEQAVHDWQAEHPQGSKADCIKDTQLSKHTVYKWWVQRQTKECKNKS